MPRHEDIWWNGGIAPWILNLDARWRWVVSFMTQPLYPRRKSLRKLFRPFFRWNWGWVNPTLPLPWTELRFPGHPVLSPVAVLTGESQLPVSHLQYLYRLSTHPVFIPLCTLCASKLRMRGAIPPSPIHFLGMVHKYDYYVIWLVMTWGRSSADGCSIGLRPNLNG
jgi:hypothetical protein